MKEIFGQIIQYIYISEDKKYLCFIGSDNHEQDYYLWWVYKAYQDDHSDSWFESISNPENIIPQEIIGIEKEESERDVLICRFILKTLKGYTDIDIVSKGYNAYGLTCEFVENAIIDFRTEDIATQGDILDANIPLYLIINDNEPDKRVIKVLPYKKEENGIKNDH